MINKSYHKNTFERIHEPKFVGISGIGPELHAPHARVLPLYYIPNDAPARLITSLFMGPAPLSAAYLRGAAMLYPEAIKNPPHLTRIGFEIMRAILKLHHLASKIQEYS